MKGGRWAFIDLLLLIVLALLLLPHQPDAAKSHDDIPPGNIHVEIRWLFSNRSDVDLWVRGPSGIPVGYSNRESREWNLLRDDLGHVNDPLQLNYENAFSRGAPAGEYVLNVHLYRKEGREPVGVRWSASMRHPKHAGLVGLGSGEVDLRQAGEEVTLLRFTLDDEGQVLRTSTVQLPIRSSG